VLKEEILMTKDQKREYDKQYRQRAEVKKREKQRRQTKKYQDYSRHFRNKIESKKIAKQYMKEYGKTEKRKAYQKSYRDNAINKEAARKARKEYDKNPKRKLYLKTRRKDSIFRFKHALRTRLHDAFKNIDIRKDSHTFDIIGLSPSQTKSYIESKFLKGMNWNNYGKDGWEVDHIIPLAIAKQENNIEDKKNKLIELCHYTNLQPLWWKTNRKKSDTTA